MTPSRSKVGDRRVWVNSQGEGKKQQYRAEDWPVIPNRPGRRLSPAETEPLIAGIVVGAWLPTLTAARDDAAAMASRLQSALEVRA